MNSQLGVRSGVARRLIIYVVLFSSFITLLTTAVQLYLDYEVDINFIEEQLQEVQRVHLKMLTTTLWASDAKELKTHLEGISQRRDMLFLEIRDKEKIWVSIGIRQDKNVMSREYPMIYTHRGRDIEIGKFTVVASLTGVYQRLIDKVWVILIGNGIKTFLVAGFILFLFYKLTTRHLIQIANFTRDLDISPGKQLSLERKPNNNKKADELDLVVTAINQMQCNVSESFAALKASRDLVQLLLDSTAEAIYGIDTQGKCTFANPACVKLLGYDKVDELLGQNMHLLIHHTRENGSLYPAEECHIYQTIKQGARTHIDHEIIWRKNNTSVAVEYCSHPIYQANELAGAVVTFIDITDRKQLRQRLLQAQKIEAIGQLTGGIAHDFNNILSAVLGFTELSLEISPNNNELHEYLNQVLLASRRARDLIAQMLAYSRGCVTEPEVLEVEPQVSEIIKMLRASIPTTVDIVLHCEKDLPSILCAPVHLHQLVINLCINARDALGGQGCIDIRVSKGSYLQQYCASCHELVAAEYLELSVTDGAQGIKPEVMERMFDNFFTTKEVGKGTGMGLSTVHSIMHELGGHLLVKSKQGVGSTFRLLFPWVEDKEREHAVEPVLTEENYASLTGKVLVVDDEVSLTRLAEEFLQSWGCEVTAVSSAQEALFIVNQNAEPFDLIITDYTMPGMNGAELLREIKRGQLDLKVIMWSGYNEEIDEEQAREFGVDIYLNKPVRPAQLFEAVKSLLA